MFKLASAVFLTMPPSSSPASLPDLPIPDELLSQILTQLHRLTKQSIFFENATDLATGDLHPRKAIEEVTRTLLPLTLVGKRWIPLVRRAAAMEVSISTARCTLLINEGQEAMGISSAWIRSLTLRESNSTSDQSIALREDTFPNLESLTLLNWKFDVPFSAIHSCSRLHSLSYHGADLPEDPAKRPHIFRGGTQVGCAYSLRRLCLTNVSFTFWGNEHWFQKQAESVQELQLEDHGILAFAGSDPSRVEIGQSEEAFLSLFFTPKLKALSLTTFTTLTQKRLMQHINACSSLVLLKLDIALRIFSYSLSELKLPSLRVLFLYGNGVRGGFESISKAVGRDDRYMERMEELVVSEEGKENFQLTMEWIYERTPELKALIKRGVKLTFFNAGQGARWSWREKQRTILEPESV
ncbi:hypothetical protein BT69DRAFT_1316435 [Atractiella rhizophila]|nr:hypothetical protein BT69DRAFT_1316435 [Atractiella rhizophila]